ncbi:MAG: ribosome small subunit-dependent GTPase A [Spirochaetota bacterium]
MANERALVAGVFGAFYHVLLFTEQNDRRVYGERRLAKTRGKLRIDYREKNTGYNKLRETLLAIGDVVEVGVDAKNPDTMVIVDVEKRRNAIHRASFGRQQCLAANVDGVVIMASVRSPDFNLGFVERCLAEVTIARADVILVVNKYDLAADGDEETEKILRYYDRCGFSVFRESVLGGISGSLAKRLESGTWLLLGQSGTGKSTLMNRLLGDERQIVGEVSQIDKGRHTTTNPALHFSPRHAQLVLIDVPGLREFGLHHRDAQEIRMGYPDFLEHPCRFENCLHLNEPGCGVKDAIASGALPEFRYRYYVSMLDTVQENFKPRKGDYWRGIRR